MSDNKLNDSEMSEMQRIDAYLFGEMDEEAAEKFEQEMFASRRLSEEVFLRESMMQSTAEQDKTLANKPALAKTAPSIPYHYMYAAAAAAIILIFTWFQIYDINSPQQMDIAELQQRYGSAFNTHTPFELRLESPMRSAEQRFESIRPSDDSIMDGPPVFNWVLTGNSGVLRLRVFDNTANPLYDAPVEHLPLQLAESPGPGLYYWTLEDSSESVLHIARFFILPDQDGQ